MFEEISRRGKMLGCKKIGINHIGGRWGVINLYQKSFIIVWASSEERNQGYFLFYKMIQLVLGSEAHMTDHVSDTFVVPV